MSNKQEVLDAIEKAHRMVVALCKPRGTEGSREWIMSIPVNEEKDPDVVIGSALRKAQVFIEALDD